MMLETIVVSEPNMREFAPKLLRGGLCWQDLIVESTERFRWVTIGHIAKYMKTKKKTLNSDMFFTVRNVAAGIFHIELVEDESEWTPESIMRLPDWVLLGGSFYNDFLEDEYSKYSAEYTRNYETDHSGTSTRSGDFVLTIKQALEECQRRSLNSYDATVLIRAAMENKKTEDIHISRIDMELIARLTNKFCYSARVLKSERFVENFKKNFMFGDTIETIRGMLDTNMKKEKIKEKNYWYSGSHISRYNFTGSNMFAGSMLVECLMKTTNCNTDSDKRELQEWARSNPQWKDVCLDILESFDSTPVLYERETAQVEGSMAGTSRSTTTTNAELVLLPLPITALPLPPFNVIASDNSFAANDQR